MKIDTHPNAFLAWLANSNRASEASARFIICFGRFTKGAPIYRSPAKSFLIILFGQEENNVNTAIANFPLLKFSVLNKAITTSIFFID